MPLERKDSSSKNRGNVTDLVVVQANEVPSPKKERKASSPPPGPPYLVSCPAESGHVIMAFLLVCSPPPLQNTRLLLPPPPLPPANTSFTLTVLALFALNPRPQLSLLPVLELDFGL